MGDDDSAAREVLKALLERTDSVYVNVVGRLVKKKDVTLVLEGQGKVETVSLTA